MKLLHSLGLRTFVLTILSLAISLPITALTIQELFDRSLYRQFDTRLDGYLESVVSQIGPEIDNNTFNNKVLSEPKFNTLYSGLYWQLNNVNGLEFRSRSLWDARLKISQGLDTGAAVQRYFLNGPQGHRLRAIERQVKLVDGSDWRLIVAADTIQSSSESQIFKRTLYIAFALLGGIIAAIAAVQVLVITSPLRRLERNVTTLMDHGLGDLQGRYPSELEPIVANLNELMKRNASVISDSRKKTADLAHELNTPLSVLRNEIDIWRQTPGAEDPTVIEESLHRIDRITKYYLFRARVVGDAVNPFLKTNIQPILIRLQRAMQRLFVSKGISITIDCDETCFFRGDAQDLEETIGNLLENACKWANREIKVSAVSEIEHSVLRIEDDGPGIPLASREAVLRRGVRANEAMPGSGIGMSIVAEFVDTYKGDIKLGDSELGGLLVTIRLPS